MLSFKQLIKTEYTDEIKDWLESYIPNHLNELTDLHYPNESIGHIKLLDFDIIKLFINDIGPYLLDITIQIRQRWQVSVYEEDGSYGFTGHPWANLQTQFRIGEDFHEMGALSYGKYSEKVDHVYPLDDQLVPIIHKGQNDEIASEILKIVYPEVLENGKAINPLAFAHRIKLDVKELVLSEDCSIHGQVYFRDCEVETMEIQHYPKEIVSIEKGTVVIDPRLKELKGTGAYNNTIIHECIHWILHYKAAMFGELVHSNMQIDEETFLHNFNQTHQENAFMEVHARSLAPCILLPREVCITKVEEYQIEHQNISDLLGSIKELQHLQEKSELEKKVAQIHWAIFQIAQNFNVPIVTAKIRLIDLGYEEAIGVLNYVDGSYVEDYAFSRGSLKRNQTFSLKYDDFIDLLDSSEELGRKLSGENYVYVESHVIKNDSKYLYETINGEINLTDYARYHMDECCLPFNVKLMSTTRSQLHFLYLGVLYHSQRSRLQFSLAYPEDVEDKTSFLREEQDNLFVAR
ncbi:hypothetical protein [Jeotgalibaca caeni]|uniref:hypothetical protein n=1 Tax=Jeotgalibaca caeni TaxID=3028623 RepID=UPI00237E70A2|nr:hypothetical protein [Jeotgalibaca caeni]MDE1549921.1 hypothetical protein [Jeotgalibaca caeni]